MNNGASDPAESASRWVERDPYLPGPRELAILATLFVLGVLAWLAASPGITLELFGVSIPFWRPDSLTLSIYLAPMVCGALALTSGLLFPRGFYLWGIALNLHAPLADGLTVYLIDREGYRAIYGGTQGVLNYVAITAVLFVFTILCYTVLSTLGMCLRYLVGRVLPRRGLQSER